MNILHFDFREMQTVSDDLCSAKVEDIVEDINSIIWLSRRGICRKRIFFQSTYRLTEQLNGAPLKPFEKQVIMDEFDNATGSAFERANIAITKVLHADQSFISVRARTLEYVDKLRQDLKK